MSIKIHLSMTLHQLCIPRGKSGPMDDEGLLRRGAIGAVAALGFD
jgi:hypothetical protein